MRVDWRPVITFERRRLELLDWMETAVNPVGFLDRPDAIGVAVGKSGQRVVVTRDSALVELRDRESEGLALTEVMTGVFDRLGVEAATVSRYRCNMSGGLETSYQGARSTLAGQISGPTLTRSGVSVNDGAYLMEGSAPWGEVLYEFGVVTADELRTRLQDPELNRVGGLPLHPVEQVPAELPGASVFLDLFWTPRTSQRVASGAAMVQQLALIEGRVADLLQDLLMVVE